MFKFKNFTVYVMAICFMASTIFAQVTVVTKDLSGYVYETTISSLVNRGVIEEIKLINNSSVSLTNITCTITINGKTHDMRPIPVLKLSDSEEFDGYFKDEINREIPKYFGKDGKFSKNNNNAVKFIFNFNGYNDNVEITNVYDDKEDLCFVISDVNYKSSSVSTSTQNVRQSSTTIQQQKDTTTVVDGKTYLLHDGKAYLIQ